MNISETSILKNLKLKTAEIGLIIEMVSKMDKQNELKFDF